MESIIDFFIESYSSKSYSMIILEIIAFLFGIISVVYAKKENILVYPTGIICTVITVYILLKAQYFGDMMMNIYYSSMSLYGWWNWNRLKNDNSRIEITYTSFKERITALVLFVLTIIVTYTVYIFNITPIELVNYIDIFTSGIFFVAMWFMANKKIESWIFWIVGDLITIPLYAYRGLGMLSLQYLIFTILAIQGYNQWKKSLVK
ncbi:nicotinamide riboside transporter PnuC [Flavobacteriaceae bacterium]|nr:nicotinamide riboside transporter PnuC [Flavobacteriaceae bacterium]MDC1492055.1 nicotinamide riboside transporter PnuC [Flavobacteriaceae bacterium]